MCPLLLIIESQECIPQINENLGESKQIQLSAKIPQQPLSTIIEEDSNQDKTEKIPLWSMYFDGSCTRTNVGVGVWINNTEKNHTECISCKLNF